MMDSKSVRTLYRISLHIYSSLIFQPNPQTYEEAMKDDDRMFWIQAMEREIDALKENGVFDVVEMGENDQLNMSDILRQSSLRTSGDMKILYAYKT